MSKYAALTRHLTGRKESRVPMTFDDVEAILGAPLPSSARTHRPWWANSGHGHVQARGWMDAGYESQEVDLEAERLVFVRLNTTQATPAGDPPAGRHPLIGCMAGTFSIAPGADLTEPVAPEWDDMLLEKFDRLLGTRQ